MFLQNIFGKFAIYTKQKPFVKKSIVKF